MDFITNYQNRDGTYLEEAKFLLLSNTIAVDIETDTRAPHDGWGSTFGLSHVAPITWVSFFVPLHNPVAFYMVDDTSGEIQNFIKDVLSRPNIRIIAHNATFDLRNLGSHYGFRVHLESDVWDTAAMARLLMMGANKNRRFGLENLLDEHNMFASEDEREFTTRMKKHRTALHLVEDPNDVKEYVAQDSYQAYRLYDLQCAIIEDTTDVNTQPVLVLYDELNWSVETIPVPFEANPFNSTKSWSKLKELVDWEVRIHRWSANAAIRGVKFNKEYSEQHMKQIMHDYGVNLSHVLNHFNLFLDTATRLAVQQYVLDIINTEREEQQSRIRPLEWFHYIEKDAGLVPLSIKRERLSLVHFFRGWFSEFHPYASETELTFRAEVATDWYIEYYGSRNEISDEQLANKPLFKKFYTFCIAGAPLPTNEDIINNTFLISGELKENAESGLPVDYVTIACETQKFSMGSDPLDFYHSMLWELDTETTAKEEDYEHPILYPYIMVLNNKAKLNRIKEFWKHSERDGRIHSLITRATNTGRMSSSQMNLQNIKMKYYRGYLIADDPDHVLGGIDVSNAENFFAALTFGDSELAKACVFGDFHETMARAYWGDDYIDNLIETDHDKFKATRKRGKAITFGGAYGAGKSKIARMVGCTPDEAGVLLMNRDLRFPRYAEGKRKVQKQAESAKAKGFKPAFTTLWTGRRVAIAEYRAKRRRLNADGVIEEYWEDNFGGYKAINYLQQGGVGELILRAQVMADEEFERRGWETTHVPMQVHDELILHAHKDHFFEASELICKLILDIVPEEFRNRTTPAVRFLAAIGAENKYKWGFNPLEEYAVDTNLFVNAWGTFELPESDKIGKEGKPLPEWEWEAPTWISDPQDPSEPTTKDEDWKSYYGTQTDETPKVTIEPTGKAWYHFAQNFKWVADLSEQLKEIQTPIMLDINGEQRGPFDFTNKMILLQHLYHTGNDPSDYYWEFWQRVDDLIEIGDNMRELKKSFFDDES